MEMQQVQEGLTAVESLLTRLSVIASVLAAGYLWMRTRKREADDKKARLDKEEQEAEAKLEADRVIAEKQNRRDAIAEHAEMASYWEERFKQSEARCDERLNCIETELEDTRKHHQECREQNARLEERLNQQAALIGDVKKKVQNLETRKP